MKFDFHFGKKETTTYEYAIIGIVLDLLKAVLIYFGATELQFMELVDEINRKYVNDTKLNDYIINSEVWLESRIERDLDDAIEDYKDLTGDPEEAIIEAPTYTEVLDGETLLGGELRLTAPYETDYEL